MKRTRIPGLIDVVHVDDPAEIRELTARPEIDRQFNIFHPLVNGWRLWGVLSALTLGGRRLPAMRPRGQLNRAVEQGALWKRLNEAAATKLGPPDLEALARWVKGAGTDRQLGILVQDAVGRLFSSSYRADEASWSAALMLRDAPRARNPLQLLWWAITGRVRNAKALLAQKVDGEIMGVHGTGITVHNIVKGFAKMRTLYAAPGQSSGMPPETVASQCLFAPPSVMRQSTAPGEIRGCPFKAGTLFILGLGEASKRSESSDMVFLDHTWGSCPAATWVPALFEGVWRRVAEMIDPTLQPAVMGGG